MLLTDVTVTRTRDTITAHPCLAGGQHRTLPLPVPEPAWKIRQTKASTIAEIDKLLDHHTCAEIAAILHSRGLPNGEGRPFNPTMVQRVIRTCQLPSRRQRLLDAGLIPLPQIAEQLGVSTGTVKIWYHAGIVSGQRYNDKREVLYDPPGPNPPAPTKDAGTTPCDLHERHLTTNRSEEVQYATRGFMRGVRTLHSTVRMSASARTASNAEVKFEPWSRIMNLTRCACSPRSMSRLRACWAVQSPVGCSVTPRILIRLLACSITART